MNREDRITELRETIDGVSMSISEQTKDGYRYATFLVSRGDTLNANRRVYPTSIWQREAAHIGEGNVTGQSGHPFWSTDLLDQFLLFTEGNVVGKDFYATARVIPTEEGNKFAAIADAGVKVAVSTRGYGKVADPAEWEDESGVKHADVAVVDESSYILRGIDIMLPGDQSVEGAGMIHFENKEVSAMETELDELRSRLADEQASVVSLKEQVDKLTEDLTALQELNAAWEAKAEELQEERDSFEAEVTGLKEATSALTQERDGLLSVASARSHLLDRARGDRFAMPMITKLFDRSTVAEVDEAWDAAYAEVEVELSNAVVSVEPKGETSLKPGDDLKPTSESKKSYEQPENRYHLRASGMG